MQLTRIEKWSLNTCHSDFSWNYVTDLPENYTPRTFPSRPQLQEFLKQKTIINQSSYRLSGREIELLAVGFTFYPGRNRCEEGYEYAADYCKYYTPNHNSHKRVFDNTSSESSSDEETEETSNEAKKTKLLTVASAESSGRYRTERRADTICKKNIAWAMRWNESIPSNSWAGLCEPEILEDLPTHCIWIRRDGRSFPTFEFDDVHKVHLNWNRQTEFYLTQADVPSAGVSVLWSRNDYEREAERHLSDAETYELVAEAPKYQKRPPYIIELMDRLGEARNTHVLNLVSKGFVTKREADKIKYSGRYHPTMIPNIHFRPKIHLPINPETKTFQSRAVVETHYGALHRLDEFLAQSAAPILSATPGLLNESSDHSSNWLSSTEDLDENNRKGRRKRVICRSRHSPTSAFIGFASVSARWQDPLSSPTSIGVEEGLAAANTVYSLHYQRLRLLAQEESRLPPIDPPTFALLLRFLCTNSYVTYGHLRFYRQKRGLPFGSCLVPLIANCFIYTLTRHAVERPPPWLFYFQRNVDKCAFLACHHPRHGENHVSNYLDTFSATSAGTKSTRRGPYLISGPRLNSSNEISKDCSIMGATLSFDPQTSTLVSKPNDEISNARALIHRSSNHPDGVFRDEIVAELTRLMRLSSSKSLFSDAAKQFFDRLKLVGYSEPECLNALKIAERKCL